MKQVHKATFPVKGMQSKGGLNRHAVFDYLITFICISQIILQ